MQYDGYSVILVREIKGVAADSITYLAGRYTDEDTGAAGIGYNREKVTVNLNDRGLISMTYEGCLKAEKTGNQVKLLGYDQIQELFRKELIGLEEKVPMKYLYLTYVRVADETKPNRYCFIPAWCMSPYQLHATLNQGMIDEGGVYTTTNPERIIWLNAIDGSRIEPKKAGFIFCQTAD